MSSRRIHPIAILLVGVAASLLAPPATAAQSEDEFLAEVRAAGAQGDEAVLRRIVTTQPLTTYERFDGLLRGEKPEDAATAARMARLYNEIFGDDALLRRVRLFAGWSAEQRAEHAAALALKDEAKSLAYEGRLEESRARSHQALERFERLNDPKMQAYCLIVIGVALSFEGRSSEGLAWFDRAREQAGRAGDRATVAYVENNRAYALIDLGDLEAARQALLAAMPISRESGEQRLEAAISMMLGTIALTLGDLDEARQRLLDGREIGEALDDAEIKTTAWSNLADVYKAQNDIQAEEEALRQALVAAREFGAPPRIALTALDLAELEARRENWSAAREWINEAKTFAAGLEDPLSHGRIEWFESVFAMEAMQFDEALEHLDLAEAAIEGAEVHAWLYSIHMQRAAIRFLRGDYEDAFSAVGDALAAAVAASDLAAQAAAHHTLAYLHDAVGEVEEALRETQLAVRLAERAGDLPKQGVALQLLGRLRTRTGDHEAAREAFSGALQIMNPETMPEELAYLRLDLARAELNRGTGHEDAVRDHIGRARVIGEALEALSVLLAADLLDIERALGAGDVGAARRIMDRARLLDPALIEAPDRWKIHHLDGRVQESRGRAEAAVAAYRRAVEEVEQLRSGLRSAARRAAALEDRILPYRSLFRLYVKQGRLEEAYMTARMAKARTFVERLNPVVFEGFAGLPPPAPEALFPSEISTLAGLKAVLRPGEALLDFFLDADALFVFVVRRDRFSMTLIPLADVNLVGLIESVRHPGTPGASDAWIIRSFEAAADRLGGLLLEPLRAKLHDADCLLVVPNAELHHVPFAALRYQGGPLVQQHRVSVLPAAELLLLARRRSRIGSESVLVVGDPAAGAGFGRLPGAAREARQIAGILGEPATLLLGEEARERAIRAPAEQARVIHLATHARVDPVFPANSFVALAPGGGEDGRWTAGEIARTKIRASLVTLSGCRTALDIGLGDPRAPGDEREGLVRAFLRAGAGSIVANLWETDDAVAQVVLPELYRRMEDSSPAQALNALQRDMIRGKLKGADGRSLAHPFYWAGLVAYEPGLSRPEGRRAR